MKHFYSSWTVRALLIGILSTGVVGCKPNGEKISGPGSTSVANPPASDAAPAASGGQ
ncbi:putative lipoprotein [Paraburkholderia xenovorans LB400]|nr:putative lipoprotein [Paraburkholderia xenovorans LB400]